MMNGFYLDSVCYAVQRVKSCSVTAFNFASTTVSYHLNRVDRDKILQTLNHAAESLNDTRLRARQLLHPQYRHKFHDEIFVQLLKRCLEVKEFDNKLVTIRKFELLPNHNLQIESFLAVIVWNLLQNAQAEIDFRVLDDKMREWNKRTDEQELMRKIGNPNEWDIFEADDMVSKGSSSTSPDREENNRSRSSTYSNSSTESLNEILKFADESVVDLLSHGDHGISANGIPLYRSRNRSDVITRKKKHSILHSLRKLFSKHEKNMTSTKNANQVRSCELVGNKSKSSDLAPNHVQHATSMPNMSVPKQTNSKVIASNDAADEGLMIHVPSNVQKIVLIKDGRRVTVEL